MYENGDIYSTLSNKFLKPDIARGYKQVTLSINKKPMRIKVHILVALLFIPNPNKFPIVNHKDGNKLNSHYLNLEWTTYYGNNKHARDTGLNNVSESNKTRWDDDEFRIRVSKNISEGIIRSGSSAGENNGRFRYRILCNGEIISRVELSKKLNISQSYTDSLIYRSTHYNIKPKLFIDNNITVIDTKS